MVMPTSVRRRTAAVSVIMKAVLGLVVAVLYISQRVTAEGNPKLSLTMAFRMQLLVKCVCGFGMSQFIGHHTVKNVWLCSSWCV